MSTMIPSVLICDLSGTPRIWTELEEGCCYEARDKVRWRSGQVIKTFLGGHNSHGLQSQIDVHAILGCTGPLVGEKWLDRTSTFTERSVLYMRDRNLCAYCGQIFPAYKLTIDHVLPKSRGGRNIWMNTVSACKTCNHRKGDRTPEEAGMPLIYVPYVPTIAEKFILKGRNILVDQMDWLMAKVPKTSRLWVDYKPLN